MSETKVVNLSNKGELIAPFIGMSVSLDKKFLPIPNGKLKQKELLKELKAAFCLLGFNPDSWEKANTLLLFINPTTKKVERVYTPTVNFQGGKFYLRWGDYLQPLDIDKRGRVIVVSEEPVEGYKFLEGSLSLVSGKPFFKVIMEGDNETEAQISFSVSTYKVDEKEYPKKEDWESAFTEALSNTTTKASQSFFLTNIKAPALTGEYVPGNKLTLGGYYITGYEVRYPEAFHGAAAVKVQASPIPPGFELPSDLIKNPSHEWISPADRITFKVSGRDCETLINLKSLEEGIGESLISDETPAFCWVFESYECKQATNDGGILTKVDFLIPSQEVYRNQRLEALLNDDFFLPPFFNLD